MELQLPQLPRLSGRAPLRARARTQSSIAVSGQDPARWVLVNASPDIRAQLQAYPDLQPNRALRDSALCAIVLVDGQVDHTTGLYMLRESTRPWPVWCTDSTYADLTRGNPVLEVLSHFCGVDRRRIELDRPFVVDEVPDVRWRALPVASKPAPYSPNRDSPVPGDNVALVHRGRAQRAIRGVCPGTRRHRRAAVADPCSGPPACSSTARSGATMR